MHIEPNKSTFWWYFVKCYLLHVLLLQLRTKEFEDDLSLCGKLCKKVAWFSASFILIKKVMLDSNAHTGNNNSVLHITQITQMYKNLDFNMYFWRENSNLNACKVAKWSILFQNWFESKRSTWNDSISLSLQKWTIWYWIDIVNVTRFASNVAKWSTF